MNSVVVRMDGRGTISGSDDRTIAIWDLGSGQHVVCVTLDGPFLRVTWYTGGHGRVAGDANRVSTWPFYPRCGCDEGEDGKSARGGSSSPKQGDKMEIGALRSDRSLSIRCLQESPPPIAFTALPGERKSCETTIEANRKTELNTLASRE